MRELAPPDELNLARDAAPILYVHASTWRCLLCDPDGTAPVTNSTVVWLGSNTATSMAAHDAWARRAYDANKPHFERLGLEAIDPPEPPK